MKQSTWSGSVFGTLAVAAMIGCVVLSLIDLIGLFLPDWGGTYVLVISILVSVEASFSYRLIRARNLRGGEVIRFRAAEMALFLVLLRIGSLIGVRWPNVWAELQAWPREPWRVLDLEIAYASLPVLLSWIASTRTAHDLARIGEPPTRDKYYVYPVSALTNRFFWGGALLLWTAGVTRIGISALLDRSRPSVPGLVLNVLLYFVLGLAMLGQIQYTRLSQRWRREGIQVPQAMAAHWVRYALSFLALAALVAFLLPTGYTLPLLEALSFGIAAVLYVFNLIFQVAVLLVLLVLTPLARLLGTDVDISPPQPMPPPQLPSAAGGGPLPGWFEFLRSAVFWLLLTGAALYVVRTYVRDRPELKAILITFRPFQALRSFLEALWRELGRLMAAAGGRLSDRSRATRSEVVADRPSDRPVFPFLGPGGLSRRQRTLYYYLSVLRRAARQGFPRPPSQTPYEYNVLLGPKVPQVEGELDRLTESFVETRYSTHAIDEHCEKRARRASRRIRAALRRLTRRSHGGER